MSTGGIRAGAVAAIYPYMDIAGCLENAVKCQKVFRKMTGQTFQVFQDAFNEGD